MNIQDMLPQSPDQGLPLPRFMNIRWPWRTNKSMERGRGIPRNDVERAMNHYGITEEEYCRNPLAYPLPERGYGLATSLQGDQAPTPVSKYASNMSPLLRPSPPNMARWSAGDIIQVGGEFYTVRGVDAYSGRYLLYEGKYPQDTPTCNWVPVSTIDPVSSYIDHVKIPIYE